MKHFFFIILVCQFFCGCSFDFLTGKPDTAEKEAAAVSAAAPDSKPLPPVSSTVDLNEALARTVFHKLGGDIRKLEAELKKSVRTVRLDVLEAKTAAGGYVDLYKKESAFQKMSDTDSLQNTSADLARAWNILDMAILYADAQTAQKKADFDQLLSRKAFHNMNQTVRNAYYRTASADLLLEKSEKMLQKARAELKRSRETFSKNGGAAKEAVERQKNLIENTRRLWRLSQILRSGKAELAALMHVRSGKSFQIVQPDWRRTNAPILLGSTAQLEHSALTARPELKNKKTDNAENVYAVREALLAKNPSLEFDIDYDGRGASLIYDRKWLETGMHMAARLFEPSLAEPVTQHSVSEAAKGGVTQIQLARQQFAAALENYQLAQMRDETARKKISGQLENADIQLATDALIARIRFHLSFAELQNASDRMYASAGMTALPDNYGTMSLSQLSNALRQGFSSQPDKMNQVETASKAPLKKQPQASGQSSTLQNLANPQTKPPLRTPAEKPAKVIKAADIKKTGRQVAKKIEIFRDVVNIHAVPSYHSAIIGQGLIGERYLLKGWTPDGWIQIEMGRSTQGWVPTKYIRPIDPAMPPPKLKKPAKVSLEKTDAVKKALPPVSAAKKADIKEASVIETVKRSNIRTEPSLDAPVIYIEEIGVQFAVREVKGDWCKIKLKNDSDGWLHKSVVESVENMKKTDE